MTFRLMLTIFIAYALGGLAELLDSYITSIHLNSLASILLWWLSVILGYLIMRGKLNA